MSHGRNFYILPIFALFVNVASKQSVKTTYPEDKHGKFILENQLVKRTGLDYQALVKSATLAAEWIQQNNPVVQYPNGFNAHVNLFGNSLPADNEVHNPGYGEMFRINFSFRYFYVEAGVMKTSTGWAAHSMDIWFNNPFHELARPLGDRGFEEGDDPSLKQSLNQAHDKLQHIYSLKPLAKTSAPGINLYTGGQLLISHPGQPSPWIQVTVGEVTKSILEYYKIRKANDEYKLKKTLEKLPENMKQMYIEGAKISAYDILLKEFEQLSSDDLNEPAWFDRQEGVYNVNTSGKELLVVKYNPDCWNKSWPQTSVQFVTLQYSISSESDLEDFRKRNHQLKDYVGYFINAFAVEKMSELIHP